MNTTLESKFTLADGMYGIPESARYLANTPPFKDKLAIPTSRLRYWIKTSVPPIQMTEFPSRQHIIAFPYLISMRMVAVLRARNIPLREIKTTEQWLRQEFNVQYPLASKGLWTYGHNVYIKFSEKIIAASKFGQQAMIFIEDWLKKIDVDMTFNPREIADSWLVFPYIRINPSVQLGEPCIDGTRVTTSTILSKSNAGDKVPYISQAYGITIPQTQAAIDWERLVAT